TPRYILLPPSPRLVLPCSLLRVVGIRSIVFATFAHTALHEPRARRTQPLLTPLLPSLDFVLTSAYLLPLLVLLLLLLPLPLLLHVAILNIPTSTTKGEAKP
ncbi:hypothetical protein CTA1_5865, partial [Colletotrichum tanaceti]